VGEDADAAQGVRHRRPYLHAPVRDERAVQAVRGPGRGGEARFKSAQHGPQAVQLLFGEVHVKDITNCPKAEGSHVTAQVPVISRGNIVDRAASFAWLKVGAMRCTYLRSKLKDGAPFEQEIQKGTIVW